MPNYSYLIVALLVLLFIIYNQLRVRQVRKNLSLRLPVILVILGIPRIVSYLNVQPGVTITQVAVLAGLLVLAVGMGALRAYTVRLWSNDQEVYRQGTWITIALWILTTALHLGLEQIGHIGEASLLLDYGLTLLVQRWVIQLRAQALFVDLRQ